MATEERLDWLDGIDEVDQETVEVDQVGYPWIQWVHGKPEYKQLGGVVHTGGWFMPAGATDLDEDAEIEGWTRGTLTHSSGDETAGWFTRDLTVSLVRSRRAWHVRVGKQTAIYPWDQYDDARAGGGDMTGRTQFLAVVQGLAEPRPVVLTVHGSVGRAMAPTRQGDSVLNQFRRYVLTPANKLLAKSDKKGQWPYRAFWLTVGPDRDDKGAPVFRKVGEGSAQATIVEPIALGIKDKMTPAEIGALFVGKELLAETGLLWEEAEEWANAWSERIEAEPAEADEDADDAVYASEEEIPF